MTSTPLKALETATMLIVATFAFVVITEIPASAQGGSRPSSIQRRVDQLNRQGEQYERDNLGREVKGEATKNDRTRARALEVQIRKDLETLQASYNEIVLAMASKKVRTDDQILEAVAVIKESSVRLKDNLALPLPKDDKDKTSATGAASNQTEDPLMTLRKHIYDFVMNPLFETPAVLDVEQAKRAGRDLDRIIEISDSLTKQKDRTRKAAS